ncbi:MAG: J domain-containing protein [Desulfuromonadales bacterium]
MNSSIFVDYYELLQLSPNADTETIESVFRHLAKKYHPDSPSFSGNDRFFQIVEAHQTLSDPQTRAGYDVRYQDYMNRKWRLASVASNSSLPEDDNAIRDRLISMLYAQRRQNMKSPGLGEHQIAHLLGTPFELVEFHLWYLKAKGWVERLETGHLAITSSGVDKVEQNRVLFRPDRLIEAACDPYDGEFMKPAYKG